MCSTHSKIIMSLWKQKFSQHHVCSPEHRTSILVGIQKQHSCGFISLDSCTISSGVGISKKYFSSQEYISLSVPGHVNYTAELPLSVFLHVCHFLSDASLDHPASLRPLPHAVLCFSCSSLPIVTGVVLFIYLASAYY